MKKFMKSNSCYLLISTLSLLLYFLNKIDISVAIFLFINVTMILILDIKYKLVVFRNWGYPPEISVKRKALFLYLEKIRFDNIRVRKSDFVFITLITPLQLFSINIMILFIMRQIGLIFLEQQVSNLFLFTYAFYIISNIYEMKIICEALTVKRRSHYIQFNSEESYKFDTITNCLSHHINVYFVEEDYKEYEKEDLKREFYLQSARFEMLKKPGFYETYTLPIILVTVGAIIPFFNSLFSSIILYEANGSEFDSLIKSYFLTIISMSSLILFISFVFKKHLYPSFKDLKIRLMVLEDLIKDKASGKSR